MLLAWCITIALPVLRAWMLDLLISSLFALLTTVILGWTAHGAEAEAGVFWRRLMWGWILNVAGNLAWGIHDVVTGERLGILSWIDGFYIARYILVFWALWRFPRRPLAIREVWAYLALLAAATASIWLTLFRPTMADLPRPLLYFFGGALYPIMDVVLLYAALLLRARIADRRMRVAVGWLIGAMVAYGMANWINFGVRSVALDAFSMIAGAFWLFTDVGTGIAALYAGWPSATPATMRPLLSPDLTFLARIPALSTGLTLALLAGDSLIRRQVDGMLLVCAAVATLAIGSRRLFATESVKESINERVMKADEEGGHDGSTA